MEGVTARTREVMLEYLTRVWSGEATTREQRTELADQLWTDHPAYPQTDDVTNRAANNVSLASLLGMVDAAERQEVATILSESAARSFYAPADAAFTTRIADLLRAAYTQAKAPVEPREYEPAAVTLLAARIALGDSAWESTWSAYDSKDNYDLVGGAQRALAEGAPAPSPKHVNWAVAVRTTQDLGRAAGILNALPTDLATRLRQYAAGLLPPVLPSHAQQSPTLIGPVDPVTRTLPRWMLAGDDHKVVRQLPELRWTADPALTQDSRAAFGAALRNVVHRFCRANPQLLEGQIAEYDLARRVETHWLDSIIDAESFPKRYETSMPVELRDGDGVVPDVVKVDVEVTEAPRLGDAPPRIAERTNAGRFGTLRTAFAVQTGLEVRLRLQSGTPVHHGSAQLPLTGWVSVPTLLTALPADKVRTPTVEQMTAEEVENHRWPEGAAGLPTLSLGAGPVTDNHVTSFRLLDTAVIQGVAEALRSLTEGAGQATLNRVKAVIDYLPLPANGLAITSGAGWKSRWGDLQVAVWFEERESGDDAFVTQGDVEMYIRVKRAGVVVRTAAVIRDGYLRFNTAG